jgi:hypothetical protein
MARHGPNGRPTPERLPDWLLGGIGRRLILERLAEDGDGWSGKNLVELGLGRAWTFEVLRVLRSVDALETTTPGSYRLSQTQPLATSLRDLIAVLRHYSETPVVRPPSRLSDTQAEAAD